MADELLASSNEGTADDLGMVRRLWPMVRDHDGSDRQVWSLAQALHKMARRTIQRHYFQLADSWSVEAQDLLLALEDLGENLTRNSGAARPLVPEDWPKIQAQLSRVLPLVVQLLRR